MRGIDMLMKTVVSRLTADGKVVNKVIEVRSMPLLNPPRASSHFALSDTLCVVCRQPAQRQGPHGWTCQRCDPYRTPGSASSTESHAG